MFIGVDGCAEGWVAVAISETDFCEAGVFKTFASLMDRFHEAKVIGVDIPIGLVDQGDREADQSARDFLKGQSSSVFNSPPRPVLAARSYDDAQRISQRVNGKGISKQSFAIVPKIIEVDAFISDERIYEVHPEVSFRLLNGQGQLVHKKKTWGGLRARLTLLTSAGIELPEDLGEANDVGIDDVVDAAAAAWSARRIAQGDAKGFPSEPKQRDRCGRLIAMWS